MLTKLVRIVHGSSMLTDEHRKEDLSRAYVQAIAARAGINIALNTRNHDYGIDGAFHQIVIVQNKRFESGISLDFQLKASTRHTKKEHHIHYELDAKTYGQLVNRANRPRATPSILLLLCLPEKFEDQFCMSEEELILRNCCYWTSLFEKPVDNVHSITIPIQRSNLFTPESLNNLLNQIERGEKLGLSSECYDLSCRD